MKEKVLERLLMATVMIAEKAESFASGDKWLWTYKPTLTDDCRDDDDIE